MVHEHIPLLLRHFDTITVGAVREAYLYLTHHAAALREFKTRPGQHGDVDDFRYEQGSEWPFAFIVNQKSLLWYFRPAGLRHPAANVATLRTQFAEVKDTQPGHITVRISTVEDARKIGTLVCDV